MIARIFPLYSEHFVLKSCYSSSCKIMEFRVWNQTQLFVWHQSRGKGTSLGSSTVPTPSNGEPRHGRGKREGNEDSYGTAGDVISWTARIAGLARQGRSVDAFKLFHQMQKNGVNPNKITFLSVLKAVASPAVLEEGKKVHAQIIRAGFESDIQIGTALVSMYCKCGNVVDAHKLFGKMPNRDLILWNAIIAGSARHGHAKEAFNLWWQMQREGMIADKVTFISILKACVSPAALEEGKRLHAAIIKAGYASDVQVGNALVIMYCKCGSVLDAHRSFTKMPQRDLISWNVMIAAFAAHGDGKQAFNCFWQMQREGMVADTVTFVSILNACSSTASLEQGKWLHQQIIKAGLQSDVRLGTALLTMYCKCASVVDARRVFDRMPRRDVVSWNAMIAKSAQYGQCEESFNLFWQMQREGMVANKATFIALLNACTSPESLEQGKWLHASIIKAGFESDVRVGTALVSRYCKWGSVADARRVFDKMPERNVVSWNAMIAGLAQQMQAAEALAVFWQMLQEGMKPDKVTFITILNACASPGTLEQGKQLHVAIIKSRLESDVQVGNALVSMYCKCGVVADAHRVFLEMPERDVVSWNAMIAGFSQCGSCAEAWEVFQQMYREGVKADIVTFGTILTTCASPAALEQGKQLHADIIEAGFESDVWVGNALVTMYCKCGSVVDARRVFFKMPERDVISWNSMIAGFAQHGHCVEALEVFQEMQREGINANKITFISILPACASLAALERGRQVHAYVIQSGCESDVWVRNALVDMYSKCGSVREARKVFDETLERNVVSWNVMIGGYAQHGHAIETLQLFEHMLQEGVKPNDVTFIGILSACSHMGLVDQGYHHFHSMSRDHGITPIEQHYGCMVDLLGRAGHLDEAVDFISTMPFEPDAPVWGSLLGACRTFGDVALAEWAGECLIQSQPQNAAAYVPLPNMYTLAGRW